MLVEKASSKVLQQLLENRIKRQVNVSIKTLKMSIMRKMEQALEHRSQAAKNTGITYKSESTDDSIPDPASF